MKASLAQAVPRASAPQPPAREQREPSAAPPEEQPARPQTPEKPSQRQYQAMAVVDLMFRIAPDPEAHPVLPEPNASIPTGNEAALYADCQVWRGSGRGEQDADNVWCPVIYGDQKGWANGLYLQLRDGRRIACIMYPKAYPCPGTFVPQGDAEPNGVVITVSGNLTLRHDPDPLSQNVLEGLYPDHIPAGQRIIYKNLSQISENCRRIYSG
jgi:hypothetical protein